MRQHTEQLIIVSKTASRHVIVLYIVICVLVSSLVGLVIYSYNEKQIEYNELRHLRGRLEQCLSKYETREQEMNQHMAPVRSDFKDMW